MSFYNTGNPVPSIDPRDLDDNAKHIDELVNSTSLTFLDRLGTPRRTLAGIEADADAVTLRSDLAEPDGAELVGWSRSPLSAAITTAADMMNSQGVNIWEFADQATGYSVGGDPATWDWTPAFNAAFASFGSPLVAPPMTGGGIILVPPIPGGSYKHTELLVPVRVSIRGYGWSSILENTGTGHGLAYVGTTLVRHVDQQLSDLRIKGNALSQDGLHFELTASRGTGGTGAGTDPGVGVSSVISVMNCKIDGHGRDGIRYGRDATVGAGNKIVIFGCYIGDNVATGVQVIGQSNVATVSNCSIVYNGTDGVNFNQVSSTCTVTENFIADNTRYGVHAFRAEQPMVTHNVFNRNTQGAVVFNGDASGSIKYTEAGLIFANLFGDNGKSAASPREVQIRASKGTNVLCNYFYGTGTPTMIYLNDNAEGVNIKGNWFKDLTTEVKLEVKVGGVNIFYIFDDDVDASALRQIQSSYVTQHIIGANTTLFRLRVNAADSSPMFLLRGDGRMEWASGAVASDVSIERINAGALRVNANVEMNRCEMAEGLSAPANKTGFSRLYVDGSAGSAILKVRTSNGALNTLAYLEAPTFTTIGLSGGQIAFPAVQVPSANPNTLDDYEEGTFTPTITFSTPGDLNVVYSNQTGLYTKIGRVVHWSAGITTTTFTHTTASGGLQIAGLPFTSVFNPPAILSQWVGVTSAVATPQIVAALNGALVNLSVMNVSAGTLASLTTANAPSGVNKTIAIGGTFIV